MRALSAEYLRWAYSLDFSKVSSDISFCDLPTMVDSFERELIVAALKRSPGNMSAAARELGISPRVLHYKMHRLGLQKS